MWDLDSWSRTNGIDLDAVSDIVIMIGTNDLDNELGSGGNIERLAHDLAEHLTEIGRRIDWYFGRPIKLTWIPVMPRWGGRWKDDRMNRNRRDINRLIGATLQVRNWTVRRFDDDCMDRPVDFLIDGLHPNRYGLDLLTTAIYRAVGGTR